MSCRLCHRCGHCEKCEECVCVTLNPEDPIAAVRFAVVSLVTEGAKRFAQWFAQRRIFR